MLVLQYKLLIWNRKLLLFSYSVFSTITNSRIIRNFKIGKVYIRQLIVKTVTSMLQIGFTVRMIICKINLQFGTENLKTYATPHKTKYFINLGNRMYSCDGRHDLQPLCHLKMTPVQYNLLFLTLQL